MSDSQLSTSNFVIIHFVHEDRFAPALIDKARVTLFTFKYINDMIKT